MKRLEQLPQIADRALGGLNADEAMKRRILAAVNEPSTARMPLRRWLPVACASLALVVALGAGIPALMQHSPDDNRLINTLSLGDGDTVNNENVTSSLNKNSVNVGSQSTIPAFRSLWEKSSDGSFPLIGVNGGYYRLMTSPADVPANVIGSKLGEVESFTKEPALANGGVAMSNCTASGTAIYGVKGMGDTLIVAKLNGANRLFQRVSFNGSALHGKETLADTLQIAGHIAMMELSGVGVVDNAATCEQLFSTLTAYADYASSGSISSQQSLLIELDNGLTVQLMVKNEKLSACGVWSCPEFFEQFAASIR